VHNGAMLRVCLIYDIVPRSCTVKSTYLCFHVQLPNYTDMTFSQQWRFTIRRCI